MTLNKINSNLENIYISPTEACNLRCHYCYTSKTKNTLSDDQILRFVEKYSKHLRTMFSLSSKGELKRDLRLKSIIFCGGEVFIIPDFIQLVNTLLSQKIFISIITNGTIDHLDQITDPKNCQLLVSLDGPKNIHDANRGQGNFTKTKAFIRHARNQGFPVEIFFLITKDSYPYKDSFSLFNLPKTYLTDRLGSLNPKQILDIKQHYPTYPSKNFGCFRLALQSTGLIYGCCESSKPLAKISDQIPVIINNFTNSLKTCQKCELFRHCDSVSPVIAKEGMTEAIPMRLLRPDFTIGTRNDVTKNRDDISCHGCCHPDFLCGYQKELKLSSCQDVIQSFNP